MTDITYGGDAVTRRPRRNPAPRHARRPAASRRVSKSDLAPVLWMVALAVFLICVGMLPTAEGRVPSGKTTTIAVRVSQDDTLWSIAASNRLPGVSTAEMVELITEANSLQSSGIRAGAVLRVPAPAAALASYAQVGDSTLSQ